MIRKIQYITFCLSAIVGVAQTSSLKFDFHTGELSQTLLSEDIDSITLCIQHLCIYEFIAL